MEMILGFFGRHELLYPHIPTVDGKDVPAIVDPNSVREVELAFFGAEPAPLGNEIPITIKFLNSLIAGIRHEHITGFIDRHPPG